MLYLKCTAAIQKVVGLRKENLADVMETDAPLGNWYVNQFEADRRNIFIFMSESTLLSFILFQGKRPITTETLPNMLLAGLQQLLEMRGLSNSAIKKAVANYEVGVYAKTDSRSTLGSLNDLAHTYRYMIEYHGGLASCDLTDIIMKLNEMPQRKLDWNCSWDVVQAKLEMLCAVSTGRCNTCIKSFGRRLKSQCLSWPPIQ